MSAHLSAVPGMPLSFPKAIKRSLVAVGEKRLTVSTILLAPDYYDTVILDDHDDGRHAGWRLADWVIGDLSKWTETLDAAIDLHESAVALAYEAELVPPPAPERDDELERVLSSAGPAIAAQEARIVALEEELRELRENYAALAARPTWSAAVAVAADVGSRMEHHNRHFEAVGARAVEKALRAKAVEAGEGS